MYAAIYIPGISPTGSVDLQRIAKAFAPDLETVGPDAVVFSIAGLRRLMGSPTAIAGEIAKRAQERGLTGSIGVARTRDLAILSARTRQGVTVVDPGKELDWLGTVPLALLPLDAETISLLQLWGIETLEQFCALPEAGLQERLGPDAAFLHRLARGEWDRPLALARPEERYEERIALEHALDNLEPLLFLLSRLLHEFCERLDRQTMSVSEIMLMCELERADPVHYSIKLPVPARDARLLLRLVQGRLESGPPPARVKAFTLSLLPVAPRFLQHDLYEPPRPEAAKLDRTLAKIRGFVGQDRVGTPELIETHRPDAWRLTLLPDLDSQARESRASKRSVGREIGWAAFGWAGRAPAWGLAFRYFRPARQARVVTERGSPVYVTAGEVQGKVGESAGPWVKSGNWWSGEAWSRKEWDVALVDGGVYRIYLTQALREPVEADRFRAEWYIEGSYD